MLEDQKYILYHIIFLDKDTKIKKKNKENFRQN